MDCKKEVLLYNGYLLLRLMLADFPTRFLVAVSASSNSFYC